MRFRWALLASLAAAVFARPVQAGDDEALLHELEQMARAQQGGGASAAELRTLVAEMLPRVARVMKRPAPSRVEVRVVSRDEARARLLAILERDYPGDALTRLAEALRAVGLVAEGTDLRSEAQQLYGGNVSGFYDPHERALYLLSDQPLAVQALIVAHELAHAIQDEMLHLDAASQRVRSSEDAQLALSAAIEGQAQQVASLVMAEDAGDLGEAGGDIASLLSEAGAVSAGMAGEQSGVPWLGLQLRFPYSAGASLVAAVRTAEDPSGISLLRRLPVSTAQVIHPDLYRSDQRPLVAKLDLPGRFPGSVPVYATTLGAANLDLFGELHEAGDLGDGWRGDRLEVVRQGGRLIATWAVAFGELGQSERLVRAWSAAFKGGGGLAYTARQKGNVAVLLVNVPAERAADLTQLAGGAFH
jgi:hypothetical protein